MDIVDMEEKIMERTKPSVKYRTVSLEDPLMDDIEKLIMKNNKYRSIADFVRESVREKIKQESSKYLGPTGVALKDWVLKYKTIEIKLNIIENRMDSMEEKLSNILVALESNK